jgi:hypothetical protein
MTETVSVVVVALLSGNEVVVGSVPDGDRETGVT